MHINPAAIVTILYKIISCSSMCKLIKFLNILILGLLCQIRLSTLRCGGTGRCSVNIVAKIESSEWKDWIIRLSRRLGNSFATLIDSIKYEAKLKLLLPLVVLLLVLLSVIFVLTTINSMGSKCSSCLSWLCVLSSAPLKNSVARAGTERAKLPRTWAAAERTLKLECLYREW